MATRYGRAFGETFYYLAEYIETAEQVKQVIKQEKKTTVIIDCVDNNKTRFILKEGIRQYHEDTDHEGNNTIMISSGNEEYAGQIVFSYVIGKYSNFYKDELELKAKSPDLIDIFPNMNIGLLPDEESCAERAVSAPQNIATNMTAADIIFGYVNKLLNKVPVDTLVYFFDSRTMIRKAYSGRKTHVKELLKLVEGNENLPKYINGEKWTGVDIVKAPTYEEVLSSSNEVDDILERASELEEESQDISLEEQEEIQSELAESDAREEGALPQVPEDVLEEIRRESNDASRTEGFPSSTLSTVQDIRSSAYFEVDDIPEIIINEEEIEGVICSTIYFDDMAVLRNVPYGIDFYEFYEDMEVQVSIQGNVNDYLTQEGSSLVSDTEINNSVETEDVISAINDSPEGARITGNLNDHEGFDFMGLFFTPESFGRIVDNNLRIYNDDTEDLGVRDVAIDNLTSFIDELLGLSIIETETIEEFEYLWTNYHETIIDEIIDANVAEEEFEPTQLPLGFDFDDEEEEEVFTYNDIDYTRHEFLSYIDSLIQTYQSSVSEGNEHTESVFYEQLTAFMSTLVSLDIINTQSIDEFSSYWDIAFNEVIDRLIDSNSDYSNNIVGHNDPAGSEGEPGIVPESDDAVNFNREESSGFSTSLDSSDAFDEHWSHMESLASTEHTILGPEEVVFYPGRYPLVNVLRKLKERKFQLELFAGGDLNQLEFAESTGLLRHVEEAIQEVRRMMIDTPTSLITIMDGGLKHHGVVVLPTTERTEEITPDQQFDDEYILSNYQDEDYAELSFDQVLEEVAEKYVSLTISILNESIPQDEMERADTIRNYISNLILSINNHKQDNEGLATENTVKINNHGAWINNEQIMGVEINDIYLIRAPRPNDIFTGVNVSILDNPEREVPFRDAIHSMSIVETIEDYIPIPRNIEYADLGPGIYKIEVIAYGLVKLLERDIENGTISEQDIHCIEDRRMQIEQLTEIFGGNEFRYIRLTGTLESIARTSHTRSTTYNLIRNLSPDEQLDYIDINLP